MGRVEGVLIKESPQFTFLKKKLHKNQLDCLNKAIKRIKENYFIGERKTGDLKDIWVYKFNILQEKWLLSYTIKGEELIILLLFGAHENFYNQLKRLLKSN